MKTIQLYRMYKAETMTSYEQLEAIEKEFEGRVISINEHRNSMGYLMGFDVLIKALPNDGDYEDAS